MVETGLAKSGVPLSVFMSRLRWRCRKGVSCVHDVEGGLCVPSSGAR